jgi:multidrug resistance efflux pump
MRTELMSDLADCTKFRQTVQARPPRIMHGTLILMSALLGTALAWVALTKANLVVVAEGRVRPRNCSEQSLTAVSGEKLCLSYGGRVIEVRVDVGEEVKRGDELLRLDTRHLDNEIKVRRDRIRTDEDHLAELDQLGRLLRTQAEVDLTTAREELATEEEAVCQAEERRAADIRLAELAATNARRELRQLESLLNTHSVAPTDVVKAKEQYREEELRLKKARASVAKRRLEWARQKPEQVKEANAAKMKEQKIRRRLKEGELQAARLSLANLEKELEQTVLKAPAGGIVTMTAVKKGDVVEAGKPVVAIAQQDGLRVDVAVPGKDVAHLRIGMPARIKLDAFDYQRYGILEGAVQFISPDSEVLEGSRETYYLVKIAVETSEVGRGEFRGRVQIGMTGRAEIVTGRESVLALLGKKIRQTVSLD